MLEEGGYLKGVRYKTLDDGKYLNKPELTMLGADLLASIRPQATWDKIKGIAKERGVGIAFDTVKSLPKLAFDQLISADNGT